MKRTHVAPANPMPSRIFLLFIFLAFAKILAAQASLSVQGVLAKSDGTAVDDNDYTVTFRLWDAPAGGMKVHEETITIETSGGVYSAALGANGTPINAAFDKIYYLGVSVGGSGSELSPRPVLTHAPYALALLGQSNTFPSTGTVEADAIEIAGAATVNGLFTADGGLTADGATINNGLTVNGGQTVSGGATINGAQTLNNGQTVNGGQTVHGGQTVNDGQTVNGSATFNGGATVNGLTVNNSFSLNTSLTLNGTLTTTNSQIQMNKPLEITSGNAVNYTISGSSRYSFMHFDGIDDNTIGPPGCGCSGTPYNTNYNLRVNGNAIVNALYAVSDERVKKDFALVNTAETLAKLMRLRVTDYRYVDEIAKGKGLKTGFVAQEVEAVEPAAITKGANFIPNIYSLSGKIAADQELLNISTDKPHDLKTGDRVRVFDGEEQLDLTVEAVASESQFSVKNWGAGTPTQVFVFGKEVNDFRAVEYDHIFTMNVAATQELARRLEILENENAALRAKNSNLETKQTTFESQLSELSKRMLLIENTGATGMRK